MKAILAIIFAIPFLTWGSGKAIAFLLSKSALKGSPGDLRVHGKQNRLHRKVAGAIVQDRRDTPTASLFCSAIAS